MNIPVFSLKDKTLMDQILGLERLRTECMRSSGTDVADDLILSSLAKSLPKALQTHIQLHMTERSTYAQVREFVLRRIHNELGILPSSSTASSTNSCSSPRPIPNCFHPGCPKKCRKPRKTQKITPRKSRKPRKTQKITPRFSQEMPETHKNAENNTQVLPGNPGNPEKRIKITPRFSQEIPETHKIAGNH